MQKKTQKVFKPILFCQALNHLRAFVGCRPRSKRWVTLKETQKDQADGGRAFQNYGTAQSHYCLRPTLYLKSYAYSVCTFSTFRNNPMWQLNFQKFGIVIFPMNSSVISPCHCEFQICCSRNQFMCTDNKKVRVKH